MIRKDGHTMRCLLKLRFALSKPQTAENGRGVLPLAAPALQLAIHRDAYGPYEFTVIYKKLASNGGAGLYATDWRQQSAHQTGFPCDRYCSHH